MSLALLLLSLLRLSRLDCLEELSKEEYFGTQFFIKLHIFRDKQCCKTQDIFHFHTIMCVVGVQNGIKRMKFRFGANLHFVGRCFTCTCSSCSSGWFPATRLPSRSTPVETEWDWKTGEGRRVRNSSIGGSFFHSESVNCESMNLRKDYFYIQCLRC